MPESLQPESHESIAADLPDDLPQRFVNDYKQRTTPVRSKYVADFLLQSLELPGTKPTYNSRDLHVIWQWALESYGVDSLKANLEATLDQSVAGAADQDVQSTRAQHEQLAAKYLPSFYGQSESDLRRRRGIFYILRSWGRWPWQISIYPPQNLSRLIVDKLCCFVEKGCDAENAERLLTRNILQRVENSTDKRSRKAELELQVKDIDQAFADLENLDTASLTAIKPRRKKPTKKASPSNKKASETAGKGSSKTDGEDTQPNHDTLVEQDIRPGCRTSPPRTPPPQQPVFSPLGAASSDSAQLDNAQRPEVINLTSSAPPRPTTPPHRYESNTSSSTSSGASSAPETPLQSDVRVSRTDKSSRSSLEEVSFEEGRGNRFDPREEHQGQGSFASEGFGAAGEEESFDPFVDDSFFNTADNVSFSTAKHGTTSISTRELFDAYIHSTPPLSRRRSDPGHPSAFAIRQGPRFPASTAQEIFGTSPSSTPRAARSSFTSRLLRHSLSPSKPRSTHLFPRPSRLVFKRSGLSPSSTQQSTAANMTAEGRDGQMDADELNKLRSSAASLNDDNKAILADLAASFLFDLRDPHAQLLSANHHMQKLTAAIEATKEASEVHHNEVKKADLQYSRAKEQYAACKATWTKAEQEAKDAYGKVAESEYRAKQAGLDNAKKAMDEAEAGVVEQRHKFGKLKGMERDAREEKQSAQDEVEVYEETLAHVESLVEKLKILSKRKRPRREGA